ncbi:hypothetical protein BBC27_05775 [Acidithiobacillus ferrivorans]|uniref:Uncharacterized protein n=1 Tax=Acidithiobacillus ferrivorans TaxID=160808 RepID=A0A1B9C1V9_9PROT|nr:hypothetical protein [Acidithiobacillus ferrivorans]OCB03903.1 hypothetical protein BBC27_05775 [Acidithiobacillus ferrivorans]
MIFTYVPSGQKRLSLGEWFALEKWPHGCPADRFHLHFIVQKSGQEYRCGPAPHASASQVSALVYHAKTFIK